MTSKQLIPSFCPYKGLMPYSEEDAPFFFGREDEIDIIADNLSTNRLTVLYGASGVGKSSLLRAGVVPYMRERVRLSRTRPGLPDFAVVMAFSLWRDDPVSGLTWGIHRALGQTAKDYNLELKTPSGSPVQKLEELARQVGGQLLIILDQFEEYFLYHGQEDGEGTFGAEFPRVVNRLNLPVNFIVSIREDSLAKLDRFGGRLPNLFSNMLSVGHLNRKAATDVIMKPIARYNSLTETGDPTVSIESKLVEALLDQLKTGQTMIHNRGLGTITGEVEEWKIEATYLQLVMTRLWKSEINLGSHTLRLETLEKLGGAEKIMGSHLNMILGVLTPAEKEAAARILRYLVTPSGTKIALTATDLSKLTEVEAEKLNAVLERLSSSGARILRRVEQPHGHQSAPIFEIYHDELASAVLSWSENYAQAQRFKKIERVAQEKTKRLQVALSLAVLGLLLMGGLIIWALQQRAAAEKAQRNQAVALAQALIKQTEAERQRGEAEQARLAEAKSREEAIITLQNIIAEVKEGQKRAQDEAESLRKIARRAREEAERQKKLLDQIQNRSAGPS